MIYKKTQEILKTIANQVVEEYKIDLKTNPKKYGNGRNSYASGKLFNSVNYRISFDDDIKLYLVVADHYVFVEEGSKFTNKLPPIHELRIWMMQRNISYDNNNDWKIQRHIFKNGIKPKPYIRDIKKNILSNFKDDIENALKEDVKIYLKEKMKNLKNDNSK